MPALDTRNSDGPTTLGAIRLALEARAEQEDLQDGSAPLFAYRDDAMAFATRNGLEVCEETSPMSWVRYRAAEAPLLVLGCKMGQHVGGYTVAGLAGQALLCAPERWPARRDLTFPELRRFTRRIFHAFAATYTSGEALAGNAAAAGVELREELAGLDEATACRAAAERVGLMVRFSAHAQGPVVLTIGEELRIAVLPVGLPRPEHADALAWCVGSVLCAGPELSYRGIDPAAADRQQVADAMAVAAARGALIAASFARGFLDRPLANDLRADAEEAGAPLDPEPAQVAQAA